MPSNFNAFKYVDKWSILLYLVLVTFGLLNIYGASVTEMQTSFFDISYRSGMQFLWIGVSFVAAGAIMLTNSRLYSTFAILFYVFIILLLILTVFIAPDIKGSRSWLPIGPFSLQPAEFAKFITALMLAKIMSRQTFRLEGFKSYAIVSGIILLPMLIIIMQKETGSALVFTSFIFMLFREGLPGIIPLIGIIAVALFIIDIRLSTVHMFGFEEAPLGFYIGIICILLIAIAMLFRYTKNRKAIIWISSIASALFIIIYLIAQFIVPINVVYPAIVIAIGVAIYLIVLAGLTWKRNYLLIATFIISAMAFCYSCEYIFENVLENHQRTRIEVMLGMTEDPTGAGYNVNQAKIAIGSGGLWGKGFLEGTQTKLKYVPEQDTDFIFCTIGEEWGFVGCTMVLLVYLTFLFRLIFLAERQQDKFVRIYGYGVFGIFTFHLIINIGMVIGLVPVIGIPLPFFSYGGSSLLSFTLLLFIFL